MNMKQLAIRTPINCLLSSVTRSFKRSISGTSPSSRPSSLPKQQHKPKRWGNNNNKQRQSLKHKARNEYLQKESKLKRQRGLHPAAKWKRILSACDYWFSLDNLKTDVWLQRELLKGKGWISLSQLLKFPKFKHWVDGTLLLQAFSCSAASRYILGVVTKDDSMEGNSKMNIIREIKLESSSGLQHFQDTIRASLLNVGIHDDYNAVSLNRFRVRHRKRSIEAIQISLQDSLETEQKDKSTSISNNVGEITTPKMPRLPTYNSNREIIIITRPGAQLDDLCQRLRQDAESSLKNNGNHSNYSAIGIDAEYSTLELDIQNNLPAMLQLASPCADGPIGLFWLDKFPNHGRNMLIEGEDGASWEPLLDLLGDSSIIKVGFGANSDVTHLLKWWGITDSDYIDYFVSNVIDLRDENFDIAELQQNKYLKLEDLCQHVLKRYLDKDKVGIRYGKNKMYQKAKQQAHWRAEILTERMKTYAANDAACSVDVWMTLCKSRS